MAGRGATLLGAAAAALYPLELLHPDATLGRCMDGTLAGFYLAPGTDGSKWMIELQGGGECATEAECRPHLGTALASSDYFPANGRSWVRWC